MSTGSPLARLSKKLHFVFFSSSGWVGAHSEAPTFSGWGALRTTGQQELSSMSSCPSGESLSQQSLVCSWGNRVRLCGAGSPCACGLI